MALQKLFPKVLVACLAIGIWSTLAIAQTRTPVATPNTETGESCSPDDPVIISTAEVIESKPTADLKPAKAPIDLTPSTGAPAPGFMKSQPLLLAAIDERLGARYRWGATGPDRFDCSGFVWSIFQSAGITFERGSARTLFGRFAPAAPEEQYKFGTLVFFSGLAHVGVVADEHGFYHASRRHGVIYSPFNEYWLKRIDGFRRVPFAGTPVTD